AHVIPSAARDPRLRRTDTRRSRATLGMTTTLGVSRPGLLTGLIRHARIEPSRRLDVTLRLRAPDLRREVTQQRELLHHAEIVRRGFALHAPGGPDVAPRRFHRVRLGFLLGFLPGVAVSFLFLVERLQQREALLWRGRHEPGAVRFLTRRVERAHPFAEDLL